MILRKTLFIMCGQKLKKANASILSTNTDTENPIPNLHHLKQTLTLSKPIIRKTKVSAKMPSHLSGDEVITLLEEKKKIKDEEKAAKAQRKAEREDLKKLCENKKAEKEASRIEKGRGRGRGSGRGHAGRGRSRGNANSHSDRSSEGSIARGIHTSVQYPVCKLLESDNEDNTD